MKNETEYIFLHLKSVVPSERSSISIFFKDGEKNATMFAYSQPEDDDVDIGVIGFQLSPDDLSNLIKTLEEAKHKLKTKQEK